MAINVVRLLVEDEINPLVIGTDRPRFSWNIEPDYPNKQWNLIQYAYRILVADNEELLTEDNGNMWDSGKVISDLSIYITYNGMALSPGTRYFYKIQTWHSDDEYCGWSDVGEFGTGLSTQDWSGDWIGRLDREEKELVPASYMRQELVVGKPIARAVLYATALGTYETWFNGYRVGDHILAPGWTDYSQRAFYQAFDVTNILHEGDNAWGIILGTGWYSGNIGMMGTRIYGNHPSCLMQLQIEYQDGTNEIFCTDRSWRISEGPILYSDMIKGESYDSRLEHEGWTLPGFNDSEWNSADTFESYSGVLQPQNGPPVRIIKDVAPISSYVTERGTTIYDFGQNMTGWTAITVRGIAGSRISINHAEMLDQDGSLYTLNLRRAVQICHYVLNGEDNQCFQPHFTFHGFRYIEIEDLNKDITVISISAKVIHSDTPLTGELTTSDELVNKLISNIQWGQRGNFLSVPTDCPQRDERLGWTGDAQIFVRTASYNMNVAGFFRKYMVDVLDAQSPEGAFPDVAPDAGWKVYKGISSSKWFAPDNAGWGDAGVIIPWTIYLMYGDLEILRTSYTAMKRWIDYLKKNSDGLIRPDYANHADWLSVGADTPKDVLATAYFGYSTALFARIAKVLGNHDDEREYRQLFEQIRESFIRAYVSADGTIKGDTQTVYVLALYFDLLTPEFKQKSAKRLEELIVSNGDRLSTGFLGVGYLLPVLTENGLGDLAYRLLHQEQFPSWLYSVKHGATTIWERWDGWTEEKGFQSPSMNSFNHYSLGSVGEWLYRYVVGIEPDDEQPGFKKIKIEPHPGGKLVSINSKYQSPYGEIRVEWSRDKDRFHMSVNLPVNTHTELRIPGEVILANGPAQFIGTEQNRSIFNVGSGSYTFESVISSEDFTE